MGLYEYASLENIAKLAEVLVEISYLHSELDDKRDNTPLRR